MTPVATRPPVADMPSPVYTQNELPPWAHSTPSPSQMIRNPDFSGDTDLKHLETDCNIGVPMDVHPLQDNLVPESLIIPPELLWGICTPFIQQMLEALQHVMQSAIKAHMASSSREDGSPDANTHQLPYENAGDFTPGSPSTTNGANVSPFHSLFNPTPTGHDVHPSHRQNPIKRDTPPSEEPLHEATDFSDHDKLFRVAKDSWHGQEVKKSRCEWAQDDVLKTQSSVTGALANAAAAAMGEEEALQEDRGSAKSKAASVGSSPVLHGLEPPWRAMVSAECSNAFTPAEAANLVYVSCFQQPVGQGCGDQQSLGEANDCGTGLPMSKFEPDEMCNMANMSDLELDKSNVVCRHWKSKGWCRLEDKCKFLHPENNCSEGNIVGSKADGPGEGIVGSTNAQEEGKGAAKSKPSRRGGRNRRGGRATVSDSCGSIGTGGIIVMASTFDS